MSNKRQKNFGDKTGNFAEIKVNIINFCLIIKKIQTMTMMIIINKKIIHTTMTEILCNVLRLPLFTSSFLYTY